MMLLLEENRLEKEGLVEVKKEANAQNRKAQHEVRTWKAR